MRNSWNLNINGFLFLGITFLRKPFKDGHEHEQVKTVFKFNWNYNTNNNVNFCLSVVCEVSSQLVIQSTATERINSQLIVGCPPYYRIYSHGWRPTQLAISYSTKSQRANLQLYTNTHINWLFNKESKRESTSIYEYPTS